MEGMSHQYSYMMIVQTWKEKKTLSEWNYDGLCSLIIVNATYKLLREVTKRRLDK